MKEMKQEEIVPTGDIVKISQTSSSIQNGQAMKGVKETHVQECKETVTNSRETFYLTYLNIT